MALNALVELAPHDAAVKSVLQEHYGSMEALLAASMTAGQSQGEVRDDISPRNLARYLAVMAAGSVVTSKGQFPGMATADLSKIVLSGLERRT